MTRSATALRPRPFGLALGAVLLLAALVLGMWRPWSAQPATSSADADSPTTVIEPTRLVLPDHPRVLVFGDSWTYGSAATLPTEGYAYRLADLLDGETFVFGGRGSGYLKVGLDGPRYGDRIPSLDPTIAPDLVIIQGSINDRQMGADGYRDAVSQVWDAMQEKYPNAAIVILGPAPQILPVEKATARIDKDLSELAAARGWWYISPIAEQWITEENYLDVIDVHIGRNHPSSQGHGYLSVRVAMDLEKFRGAPITQAEGSEPTPKQ